MELPNIHFEDYSIEFKEINPEDFPHFEVENNREKHIISPDEDGYIDTAIQPIVQLGHKNTLVINAAVGQGKSYAIIQTIKRFYEADEDYLIVVASPFVGLVTHYYNIHLDAVIPEGQIYNYGGLITHKKSVTICNAFLCFLVFKVNSKSVLRPFLWSLLLVWCNWIRIQCNRQKMR